MNQTITSWIVLTNQVLATVLDSLPLMIVSYCDILKYVTCSGETGTSRSDKFLIK